MRQRLLRAAGSSSAWRSSSLLALFPFSGAQSWIVNIGIFTLMYAALGSAWNLIGGYTGYVSLGSVAFFGLGAYWLALTFQHIGVGNGFLPFALVPVIGIVVALISLPLGFIAFRTRGLPFIIVTISLVIILQYCALNLTAVTGGAPGSRCPRRPSLRGRTRNTSTGRCSRCSRSPCWRARTSSAAASG